MVNLDPICYLTNENIALTQSALSTYPNSYAVGDPQVTTTASFFTVVSTACLQSDINYELVGAPDFITFD